MNKEENTLYDVVIIGGGIAGLGAALEAYRLGRKAVIIDAEGFSCEAHGNYADKLGKRAWETKGIVMAGGKAALVDYRHGIFKVSLEDRRVFCGLTVIAAIGTTSECIGNFRADFIEGDAEKAVKGRTVLVQGFNGTSTDFALHYARFAKTVYMFDEAEESAMKEQDRQAVKDVPNIVLLPNSVLADYSENIKDRAKPYEITLADSEDFGHKQKIGCRLAIVYNYRDPDSEILRRFVDLEGCGYISNEDYMSKKVPGLFAAGTCRAKRDSFGVTELSYRFVYELERDGAAAAKKADEYVKNALKR